jgi:hypothetical protein
MPAFADRAIGATARADADGKKERTMAGLLWVIAVVLVIAGIVTLVRGGVVAGIALIVVGLLVGPGGVSVFT